MDEEFTIEVCHNGKDYSCNARLVTIGHTHKFLVGVNSIEVTYEPDEERFYRAIVSSTSAVKDLDRELIRLVGDRLQSL